MTDASPSAGSPLELSIEHYADMADNFRHNLLVVPLERAQAVERKLAEAQREKSELLKLEHDLSDSYVTVREIIGAIEDTPETYKPEVLWRWVEGKAREVMLAKLAAESECARLREELKGSEDARRLYLIAVGSKQERIDALALDAERYRWLTNAAIDAALKAGGGDG